jgi:hypothetical protein
MVPAYCGPSFTDREFADLLANRDDGRYAEGCSQVANEKQPLETTARAIAMALWWAGFSAI